MTITTIVGLPLRETHTRSDDGLFYVMKEKYAVPYRVSVQKQLEAWVAGKSEHNHFSDECCPDFSCCHPENSWSEKGRKAFATASAETREAMLLKQSNFIKEAGCYIPDRPPAGTPIH